MILFDLLVKKLFMKIKTFFILIITIIVISCNNDQIPVKLESISITTLPLKTEYIIGEALNSTGMVVTAVYNNGTFETVCGYTLSGFNSVTPGNKAVTVSFNGKTATFTVTVLQVESFNITFTQLADYAPVITGPTIYRLDRVGRPSTVVVVVDDPNQYDLDSVRWYINGNMTIGNSVTLKSVDYSLIGEYFMTVTVKKGGIPYNKTVTFTVLP